jgi:hypothetical protein
MPNFKMIEKLIDRGPLAIIVIGVLMFFIGAVGGLPVGNPPLQITDPTWRIGIGILGFVLAAAGLFLQFREAPKPAVDLGDDATVSRTSAQLQNQVHKYSGTWLVQNRFSRWRRRNITEPDKVSFDGKALLVINIDGKGGMGIQIGRLEVCVGNYHAIYEIVNEVQNTSVDKDGTLRLQVKVIRRQLIMEEPPVPKDTDAKDPYADLRGPLTNPYFPLVLQPVTDTPLRLEGSHHHEDALSQDQIAAEKYVYQGLFIAPGL